MPRTCYWFSNACVGVQKINTKRHCLTIILPFRLSNSSVLSTDVQIMIVMTQTMCNMLRQLTQRF